MKVLVIDNYDSFTYNLVYILRLELHEVEVFRNDKISPEKCLEFDALFLSPGPGLPKDAGNLKSIIRTCAGKIPILGICLGHQAIAEYLGGKLINMEEVFHGVQSDIEVVESSCKLFKNIAEEFQAGRYHSWEVDRTDLNNEIEIVAITNDNSIMAIQNLEQKLYGIQFHPESILTAEGTKIIQNFIDICKNNDQ